MKLFASAFAKKLAAMDHSILFLHGNLGSGKTTFTQMVLHELGWQQRVKSPTYSLIEPYEIGNRKVYHLDLYRLQRPEELYFMGIQDIFNEQALFFIEWPERIQDLNLQPDIEIFFSIDEDHIEGRNLGLHSRQFFWDDILSSFLKKHDD